MTLWLVHRKSGEGSWDREDAHLWGRINGDVEPCLAVQADGIAGGWSSQYWLEDDGVTRATPTRGRSGRGRLDGKGRVREHPDKPPYRIPTMTEIAETEPNGLAVVSTFTGAGGSCLGFKMAGFRTVWASEFVEAARETYAANFPDVPLDARDIRTVTGDEIRATTGLDEIDVLEGSPPCAAFSLSGRREDGWGEARKYSDDKVQRVDDLVFEFVRLVGELRPRAFVFENVKGLTIGKAKGYMLRLLDAFKAAGYEVDARVLDAQWLGVPQRRERVIVVGIRNDVDATFEWPSPLPYRYSIRDALGSLTAEGYEYDQRGTHHNAQSGPDLPVPTIRNAGGMGSYHHTVPDDEDEDETVVRTRKGRRSLDEPAPTVLTHGREHTFSEMTIEHVSGRHAGKRHLDDEPAPTIQAGGIASNGIGNVRVRGAGHRTARDVTDEPSPTIGAKSRENPTSTDRVPFVETGGRAIYDQDRELEFGKPTAPQDVTDDVAPTIRNRPSLYVEGVVSKNPKSRSGLEWQTTPTDGGPSPTVRATDPGHIRYEDRDPSDPEGIIGYAIGEAARDLLPGEVHRKYQNLIRADEEEPSPAVTAAGGGAGTASVVHPNARRKFTIGELRRLCGFPDDFVLTGAYRQQWERLGRAVPPPMMRAVAEQLAKALRDV